MQIAQIKNTNWLKAYSLAWKFIDLVYPPTCIGCGKIGFRCCPECWSTRSLYDQAICPTCGKPLHQSSLCENCAAESFPLEKIRSVGEYAGVLRDFILSLKYHRNIGLAELILPDLTKTLACSHFNFEMLVPVPLNKTRQRERGYNQVAVWGKLLSNTIGIPMVSSAITRERNTVSQVTLPAEKRSENVRGAFSVQFDVVNGKNILLLDDVVTTGATLIECAKVLKNAGAKQVSALTIARSSIRKVKNKGGFHVTEN
ncbi:MAG: double zinc ribbon domain-containing protein [Anaerolineaceae bacterium]